jgi:hypothetical protein
VRLPISRKEKRPRSDSVPNSPAPARSGDSPFLRKRTNSAPVGKGIQDTEKFAPAPPPSSVRIGSDGEDYNSRDDYYSCSRSAMMRHTSVFSTTPRETPPVEMPQYRSVNLRLNGIILLSSYDPLPQHISSLVDQIRKYRTPKGPSLNQIRSDTQLKELEISATKSDVAIYFQEHVFPLSFGAGALKSSLRLPMARQAVPSIFFEAKVSTPVPDILCGYNSMEAFTDAERSQLLSMVSLVYGNKDTLVFPFLAVKKKGDGPATRGSLWVATNQCLGAAPSCVNIVVRFNRRVLENRKTNTNNIINDVVKLPPSTAFSIAMTGSKARLYVSWKHDDVVQYHTALLDGFLLQRPRDFLDFRRCVLNIIAWGMDARLAAIRSSLRQLAEEGRKAASGLAKARPSPWMEERGRKRRRGDRRGDGGDEESSTEPLAR